MKPLPPSSPMSHKVVVGTIATIAGACGFWWIAKDFQFVKFEPRSPEEMERWKKEGTGLKIKQLETRTLEYTDEAKERMRKHAQEVFDKQKRKELELERKKQEAEAKKD